MRDKQRPLSVVMVTHRFPAAGESLTGTPAHIVKLSRALRELGVLVGQLDVEGRGGDCGPEHRACTLGTLPWKLTGILRDHRPDILHAHGHIPALAILPFARFAGIPVLCELHGLYVPSQAGATGARALRSRVAAALEGMALRGSDHVIAQAATMRQRVMGQMNVSSDRITVLYPGLRVAEFSEFAGPEAQIPGIAPEHSVVMYVGSTFGFQGLDLLAQAMALSVIGQPMQRLVLVLSGDPDGHAAAVRHLGFDPLYTVVVPAGDGHLIPAYCRRADVLVHSRPDCPDNINVQSKLGLYLAAGRPIVATDVGDYPLLLGASAGCRLAAPNPHALAEALLVSLGNSSMAAAAASENIKLAHKYFDVDENVRRLIGVYGEMTMRGATGIQAATKHDGNR